MTDFERVSPDEAQKALDSIGEMEGAGRRRAVPGRGFGAGIAILIASMFAVYALDDPYPYIVFPIIALAIFMAKARETGGAHGRAFTSKRSIWGTVLFAVVLVSLFFASIYIRRAYDAAWVPLLTGLVVGIGVYIASLRERRAYLNKSEETQSK